MCPILFHFGHTYVAAYGVLVSLGYLTGILWLRSQLKNMEMTQGEFWALVYTLFVAAIVGGRVGYYIVEWRTFIAQPGLMLRHWRTGWVFWFGFAATILAGWGFQQVYNHLYRPRAYLPVADYFGVALPLGHWIGRAGCFLNGCCYGRPTAAPWGVRFSDPASDVETSLLGVPLHPTQLYEAAGEIAIFLFLWRFVLPRVRRGQFAYGTVFYGYIVLYSILRSVVEFFRGDDRGVFLWPVFSPSQWASVAAFLVAGILLHRNGIIGRRPAARSIYL